MTSSKRSNSRKRLTTFRVDAELRAALNAALARDGVSERRKSRWLCAAVQEFVHADPRMATVGAGENLKRFTLAERILMDEATEDAIDRAIRLIRASDYRVEGLQASIIRAAIRHAAGSAPRENSRSTPKSGAWDSIEPTGH